MTSVRATSVSQEDSRYSLLPLSSLLELDCCSTYWLPVGYSVRCLAASPGTFRVAWRPAGTAMRSSQSPMSSLALVNESLAALVIRSTPAGGDASPLTQVPPDTAARFNRLFSTFDALQRYRGQPASVHIPLCRSYRRNTHSDRLRRASQTHARKQDRKRAAATEREDAELCTRVADLTRDVGALHAAAVWLMRCFDECARRDTEGSDGRTVKYCVVEAQAAARSSELGKQVERRPSKCVDLRQLLRRQTLLSNQNAALLDARCEVVVSSKYKQGVSVCDLLLP
jgi:hypothetical protein